VVNKILKLIEPKLWFK